MLPQYHPIIQQVANSHSDFPDQARAANKRFVAAINIPEINIAFTTPDRIANIPPKKRKNDRSNPAYTF